MKRNVTILGLLSLFIIFSFNIVFASSYVPIGKGCTNAYYIDKDCDGYGVASPLGVDADDNDPEVNTPETVIAKYKTLTNFLHHLGYNPDRIFYIATNGNDDTGEVNNINKPYKTWEKVQSFLQPGDLVIFRKGIYNYLGTHGIEVKSSLHGTLDKPIVVMTYPGEKVIIDSPDYGIKLMFSDNSGPSYLTFDGFILDNTQDSWGDGFDAHLINHIILRNIEAKHHSSGIYIMHDLHDLLIENCVVHDNTHSHGFYLGCTYGWPTNTNITVRNCIMYRNGRHGFQHNGRVKNLILENNIIHSNKLGGISLIKLGDYNPTAIVRNNLIFNNNKQGIVLFIYESSSEPPYTITNTRVINNLIWVGKYMPIGEGTVSSHAIAVNDTTGKFTMKNLVFRNNIIMTYDTVPFRFCQLRHLYTAVIENNVLYKKGNYPSPSIVMVSDEGQDQWNFEQFENFSDLIKNNTFQDPKFTDISIDYYSTPEKFNFDYLSDSPAIDFGTTTDNTPLTDLRSNSRIGNPDAGCYEYLPQNLTILTSTLPEGTVNQSYSATIQSFGGTPPYTYSIASGNLPLNLNLSSNGVISGKPTQSGNYNFTIKVTDSSNNEDTKKFTLIVNDEQIQPLTITTESLPEGTVDVEYSATLSASGGTTPYTWSVTPSDLPNGLSLNSSAGTISGTPTTQGTFNFTVQVKDNENNTTTKNLSITINSPSDTTPPVRSNGSPTGELSIGTTQVTLSLTTDEDATCKYSTTSGVPYSSMTNAFSTTGGTSHSTTITGLSSSNTYNYYIKCIDTSNNANTDDYHISFSIASPHLTGDLNYDNKVNSQDFQILIQKFRQTKDIENEDLNSDGIVDVKDIGIMMHHWTN